PLPQLAQMLADSPRANCEFMRLFAIGDSGDDCFLLDQGLLKVSAVSPFGEERIIAIHINGSGRQPPINGRGTNQRVDRMVKLLLCVVWRSRLFHLCSINRGRGPSAYPDAGALPSPYPPPIPHAIALDLPHGEN